MVMTAFLTFEHDARTVGDLRAALAEISEWGISDDTEIELGTYQGPSIYITVRDRAPVTKIECGNHMWPERVYDALIDLHECEET